MVELIPFITFTGIATIVNVSAPLVTEIVATVALKECLDRWVFVLPRLDIPNFGGHEQNNHPDTHNLNPFTRSVIKVTRHFTDLFSIVFHTYEGYMSDTS